MFFSSAALSLIALASSASAHMEMTSPIPFRSKHDPDATNIDYSMTSPLSSDGSNYPCKGYQSDLSSTDPKANLVAGQSFTLELAGSATHGGGSCELSVSYDEGETFAVIHRMVGGCPLESSYDFDIPADLPASDKALFAWSWFNKIGNREMYMNCAAVSIQNDAGSDSYTGPEIFRANTFPDGTCRTDAGSEPQFPHVDAVPTVYGGQMSADSSVTELSNCPVEESSLVTVTSSGSSEAGGEPSDPDTGNDDTSSGGDLDVGISASVGLGQPSASSSPEAPESSQPAQQLPAKPHQSFKVDPSEPAPSSAAPAEEEPAASSVAPVEEEPAPEPTSQEDAAQPQQTGASCTEGEIICDSESSWSMCAHGQAVSMGDVAGGMACREGQMVQADVQADSGCSDGSITCSEDGSSWSQCWNGQIYPMGNVAGGTTCTNGSIVADAQRKRMVRRHRNTSHAHAFHKH